MLLDNHTWVSAPCMITSMTYSLVYTMSEFLFVFNCKVFSCRGLYLPRCQPSVHSFLLPQGIVATINYDFCCKGYRLQKNLEPADSLIESYSLLFLHWYYFSGHSAAILNVLTQQRSCGILNNANQVLTSVEGRKTCYDK